MSRLYQLADIYQNKPVAQVISLMSFRLHPGMGKFENEDKISEKDRNLLESLDTTGLDALVAVVRCLLAFGLRTNTSDTITGLERTLLKFVGTDLGYVAETDQLVKRQFALEILANSSNSSSPTGTKFCLRNLIAYEDFGNLIYNNKHFQLTNTSGVFGRDSRGNWHHLLVADMLSRDLSTVSALEYKGREPLAEFITAKFGVHTDLTTEYFITCSRPDFMLIWYQQLADKGQPISDLRTFHLELPEVENIDGDWKFGTFHGDYQLLLVAKLSAEIEIGSKKCRTSDQLRVYGLDGGEVVPSEVGNFESKEPEAMAPPWSIQDPGDYMLIYFRVLECHGCGALNLKSPEWTERNWVKFKKMAKTFNN